MEKLLVQQEDVQIQYCLVALLLIKDTSKGNQSGLEAVYI